MQKKIVVHMYLKNGKAVTGFDGKELLEDGDVMSIAQHYSNNGADELLIFVCRMTMQITSSLSI